MRYLCAQCMSLGFCRQQTIRVLTAHDLTPQLVRDARTYAASFQVPHHRWLDHFCNLYRDLQRMIVDRHGNEVLFDLTTLEQRNIKYWFRSFARIPKPHVTPRVRAEVVERVIMVVSVLRANHPDGGFMWGIAAANDN